MVDRPSAKPSPEVRRPGRMATFAALSVSGLLHGALAATFLTWDGKPSPLPAAPAVPVIMVELVSVAPQPGPANPGQVTAAATGTGGDDDMAAEAIASAVESLPQDPTSAMAEPAAPKSIEEIRPAPGPAPAEAVPQVRDGPATPPPDKTALFANAAPPPEFVGISPPARPRKRPSRSIEPKAIETSFDTPVAEILPEDTAKAPPAPSSTPDAAPDSGETIPASDIPMETAGLPDGGEARDTVAGGGGNLGGMFSGPGFRLGSASNPLPRYPSIARRRGWEGRVVLRVKVDTDGHPLSVTVASSSPFSALDAAASRAIKGWRFEPAQRAGLPVEGFVDVPIVFRLRD